MSRDYLNEKVEFDWEEHYVNSIVGSMWSHEHTRNNFVNILSRVLLKLQQRKDAEDEYYRGFGKCSKQSETK